MPTVKRDELEGLFGSIFTPKKGWGKEIDPLFMAMFGDGRYHSGPIGGVDRQMYNGAMNEYQGMGDYGALGGKGRALGKQMERGNESVSKHGGFAASSVYNMDPNYERYMNKTVHFNQDPNLWQMYMHPYDAERWGDYLPGTSEEQRYLADRNRFRDGGERHTRRMGGSRRAFINELRDRRRRR